MSINLLYISSDGFPRVYDGCISYHEVAIRNNDNRNETIPGSEDKEDDHSEEARRLRPSSFLYLSSGAYLFVFVFVYIFVCEKFRGS